jgi:hypothetical protein
MPSNKQVTTTVIVTKTHRRGRGQRGRGYCPPKAVCPPPRRPVPFCPPGGGQFGSPGNDCSPNIGDGRILKMLLGMLMGQMGRRDGFGQRGPGQNCGPFGNNGGCGPQGQQGEQFFKMLLGMMLGQMMGQMMQEQAEGNDDCDPCGPEEMPPMPFPGGGGGVTINIINVNI